jgi:hypothetical protein
MLMDLWYKIKTIIYELYLKLEHFFINLADDIKDWFIGIFKSLSEIDIKGYYTSAAQTLTRWADAAGDIVSSWF